MSGVLVVLCVLGLVEFAKEAGHGDPTARNLLGIVSWAFGLAVAFASPLALRLSPIGRPRITTAIVASALIVGSWFGGLVLNAN